MICKMVIILYLPYEMIMHIFGFVEDKIGLSMVCKLFDSLLLKMYTSKQLSNINDSYYLKYMDNIDEAFIQNNIKNIHNHNCLNLIMYNLYLYGKIYYNTRVVILYQNCMTNNISKPKYISKLSKSIPTFIGCFLNSYDMLDICIKNKSYGILKILLRKNNGMRSNFMYNILKFNDDDNKVVDLITCLVENDVITYECVLNKINLCIFQYFNNENKIKRWNNIFECINKHVDIKKLNLK